MEKNYTKDSFEYEGAGFPVTLLDFPFRKVGKVEVLDMDTETLDLAIAKAILLKPAFLTGDEIRFLRHLLGYSLRDFASEMGLGHSTIKSWEDEGEEKVENPTNDFAIRNFVAGKLEQKYKISAEFAYHQEAIQASTFWEPEPLQIPFKAMAEFTKRKRKEIEASR